MIQVKHAAPVQARQDVVQPSATARRLLWHVFALGTLSISAPDHHEPFEKPGAHLFWVRSGTGRLRTSTGEFELKPGRYCWFIDMVKPRTYIPTPGKKLTLSGIRFGGPALDTWHEVMGGNHQAEFILKDVHSIRQSKQEIHRLVTRQPVGWEWRVHIVITQILGELLFARKLLISPQSDLPKPVVRVLDAVSANPDRDWKARELGKVARISYSGLRLMFRATQEETLHDFLQRNRTDRARLLLADPALSIKEIAQQLNFSSEFYFSHFFRRSTGMSPTRFRLQLKENNR